MLGTRLIKTTDVIKSRSSFLRRSGTPETLVSFKCNRNMSSKKTADAEMEELDQPIKYSSSPAAKWRAAQTHRTTTVQPDYQPYIVSLSTAIFLIYFCILREENDLDIRIGNLEEPSPVLKGIPRPAPKANI